MRMNTIADRQPHQIGKVPPSTTFEHVVGAKEEDLGIVSPGAIACSHICNRLPYAALLL
jgi:hypothetical protein